MNDAPVSAEAAANEFIRLGANDGNPMSNLLLHKLLFLAQGFFMAKQAGEKLFDDDFEAWVHGPVVPSLYKRMKQAGNDKMIWDALSDSEVRDDKRKRAIEDVYRQYGRENPWNIVAATHRNGSAWSRTLAADEQVIDKRLIKSEFSDFV